MNEENMSLLWSSDLAAEIKALMLENNILKDKIRTLKRQIKLLVQQHDNICMEKNKTNAKMRLYTGTALASLFNKIITWLMINQTIHSTYHVLGRTETCHPILKRTERKKISTLNSHDELRWLRLER